MAEMTLVGSGSEMSLLRQCAQACVDNGGEWYSSQQALAILGDFVGNPALFADSAYIGMAKPECIARLFEQQDALVEALRDVLGWMPGEAHWNTLEPLRAVQRARGAIAKATEVANGPD